MTKNSFVCVFWAQKDKYQQVYVRVSHVTNPND